MNIKIRCPHCNMIELEYDSDEMASLWECDQQNIIKRDPYTIICSSCEKFFIIETDIKITKMELVEVK